MLNKDFFDKVRLSIFGGSIRQSAVTNMNAIFDAWLLAKHGENPRAELSLILGTVLGECGFDMEPIRETFAKSDKVAMARLERAFKAGKLSSVKIPYWREGYFGRGYVQLTHYHNYKKQSQKHDVDFVNSPELALVPHWAAKILIGGMYDGDFTGYKIADFVNKNSYDAINSRKIVNGLDRAVKFSKYINAFYDALDGVDLEPKKETTKMNTGIFSGIIRHAITTIAGYAGIDGLLNGDEINSFSSAVIVILTVLWSAYSKAEK